MRIVSTVSTVRTVSRLHAFVVVVVAVAEVQAAEICRADSVGYSRGRACGWVAGHAVGRQSMWLGGTRVRTAVQAGQAVHHEAWGQVSTGAWVR